MRLVLVHSSGLGPRQWSRLRRLLPEPPVVPALTGYGDVPCSEAPHFEHDLAVLEAQVRPGDFVFGHSYGGFLALQLALRVPLGGLLVHEPVCVAVLPGLAVADEAFFQLPQGGTEAWVGRLVEWWNGPGAWEALPASAKAPFLEHATKVHAEVASNGRDRTPASAYAAITAPTVVTAGANSRPEGQQMGAVVAEAMGARFERLGDADHMTPVTDPARFLPFLP